MARIVPSQAVEVIDNIFPWATRAERSTENVTLSVGHSEKVAVIVKVVEQIPSELIKKLYRVSHQCGFSGGRVTHSP